MDEVKNHNGKKQIGGSNYLNTNCWLVKNLGYAPYKRCQYCEFRFRHCLFLQYQAISIFLVVIFFIALLIVEKNFSVFPIVTIFALIIVYGYFFNRSTEKIIKSNFSLKQTRDELRRLTENLEDEVNSQTKDIREKSAHLQELLKMKSEFLSIASHQLRTPLTAIRGLLAMQVDGDFDTFPKEGLKKQQQHMLDSANRLSNLVNDFLKAMELEGGGLNFKFQQVQLEDLIDSACADLKPNYDHKGLYLKFDHPKPPLPKIEAEPKMLREVLMNTIDNAEKYTNKGGTSISVLAKNDAVTLIVKDTGIGIPRKDKPRLFQKFSRGEKSAYQHTDGSGLGLFITRNVINEHHGTVVITSAGENKGSTVTITLPIHQPTTLQNSHGS
jgi:signal transduction histidine kinase